MSDFQVIATLNYHLLNKESLEGIVENGGTILRVNGSHIQPAELQRYVVEVRKYVGHRAKLLVDLPGNKIRTAALSQPIVLSAGKTFELDASQMNYPKFVSHLRPGDILLANDSLFKFRVEAVNGDKATLYSFNDGQLKSNKGVHLTGRHLDMPFLFDRDRELIAAAVKHGVDYAGLSFVRTAADVEEALTAVKGTNVRLIVKVETAPAIENLDAILAKADEFLVDRGDLSCDVGMENIDHFQKLILRRAKKAGKRVYFATQFLHSMLENNVPLIAEACGLSDVIRAGVDGVQLSEETAIGKYPIEVLKTVQRIHAAARPAFDVKVSGDTAPVLWFTGHSGAGKTTIARIVSAHVESLGYSVCVIDGDDFRAFFNNDVGYTKEDRIRNQRSIAFTAYQASKSFDLVIVSSLSPYRELREFAREKLVNFHEVYVNCAVETCRERDPKGHYKKALTGQQANFVGVSQDYEAPTAPSITLNTDELTANNAARALQDYLFGTVVTGAGQR